MDSLFNKVAPVLDVIDSRFKFALKIKSAKKC